MTDTERPPWWTPDDDLVEFLRARYAEDEANPPDIQWSDHPTESRCAECGGIGEQRWLADVEAKRQIIAIWESEYGRGRER